MYWMTKNFSRCFSSKIFVYIIYDFEYFLSFLLFFKFNLYVYYIKENIINLFNLDVSLYKLITYEISYMDSSCLLLRLYFQFSMYKFL